MEEALPYFEFRHEEVLFRKAVLGFLGIKEKESVEDEYCFACKKSRGIDVNSEDEKCKTCPKTIEVRNSKDA